MHWIVQTASTTVIDEINLIGIVWMLPQAYPVLFHGRQDYSSVADFRDTSELLWPKNQLNKVKTKS